MDSGPVILKHFPFKKTYPDRFSAECDLLTLANRLSPKNAPKLFKQDKSNRIMILEFINGEPYNQKNLPTMKDIEGAVEFYKKINSDINMSRKTIRHFASDYFPSTFEHMNHVDQRIKNLSDYQINDSLKNEVQYCLDLLEKHWRELKTFIFKEYSASTISKKISMEDLQISPSDFGFHNALRTNTGPVFFDFEFSGWDDPAKTIIDFFLQPSVPVSNIYFDRVREGFTLQSSNDKIMDRIACLHLVLRTKWLCIILNVLNKNRRKEMEHAVKNFDKITLEKVTYVIRILEEEEHFGIY